MTTTILEFDHDELIALRIALRTQAAKYLQWANISFDPYEAEGWTKDYEYTYALYRKAGGDAPIEDL